VLEKRPELLYSDRPSRGVRTLVRRRSPILCALATTLVLPSAALADVMEINGGDAVWIAGGPKAPPSPIPAEAAPGAELGVEPSPLSVTQISGTAGPSQFQARVAELAAKYDISPTLLEAVVWQESRWNQGAVSPVGARGLTQLMPGTARQMGVNPADAAANLEGGARYLRLQLDAFNGDLEKALAAYNAGPGRVQRAGGIPAIRETQDYVSSILARLSAPVRK
jgi:soluble lytic murein transglycosylase-like protein